MKILKKIMHPYIALPLMLITAFLIGSFVATKAIRSEAPCSQYINIAEQWGTYTWQVYRICLDNGDRIRIQSFGDSHEATLNRTQALRLVEELNNVSNLCQ